MINSDPYSNINNNNLLENIQDVYTKEIEFDEEIYILKLMKINDSKISLKCENKYDYLSLYTYSITFTLEELRNLSKAFKTFENIDEAYKILKNIIRGIEFTFKEERNKNNYNPIDNNYSSTRKNFLPNINNKRYNNSPISNAQNQNNFNMNNNINNYNNNFNDNNTFITNMGRTNINFNPKNANMNNNMNSIQNLSQCKENPNYKVNSKVELERSYKNDINMILTIPLMDGNTEKININFNKEEKDLKNQFEKLKNKCIKITKLIKANNLMMNNNINNLSMQIQPSNQNILEQIKEVLDLNH